MIGLVAAVLLFPFAGSTTSRQDAPAPASTQQVILPEAQQAAEQWLALMDKNRWEDSWAQSGATFKTAIDAKGWRTAGSDARSGFGSLESRHMITGVRSTALPGVPAGDYHVFQFKARFTQGEAFETVVVSFEDGQWKGMTYFIRPA